jgi:DNA-binding XRE family transcriptional regulator
MVWQDIATPNEVSTQTYNLIENSRGQKKDVDPKLNHPMNNRLKGF